MSTPEVQGIAIVGLAGRFPGARDARELWRNLAAGKDCLTRFSDEELRAAGYDPAALRALPGFVPVRGLIDRPEWFDRHFFGIPPKEAEVMDPQQRVFLEVAWEALEDAGCDPSRYPGLIGVFAGMSNNTYYPHFVRQRRDLLDAVGIVNAVIANEKDFLTTRLSYKLNLRGPAVNIQTACSSSLVAVAIACQQLLNHECDAALAGGVSITFPQARGYFYSEGGMTSADGWCRPFDARANGTVFSSGAGVVVLKRLEEAIAEGDQIYAVIRGQALNNDGAKKVSFAAPSIDGQAEVVALAQALAGVSPESISYVEAHGTATPLGDPIEVAGLAQVFGAATARRGFCALGTMKGNMGHLDATAGVAGLIKTALAFRHEALPPTINSEQPNPALHLDETAFFINRELRPWPRGAEPRRAGVSSLGVGGTNAHVVLEETPELPAPEPGRAAQMLVLSAKTPAALARQAENLAQHLEEQPGLSLAEVAWTLGSGRQRFAHRRAVLARDSGEAAAALREEPSLHRVDERSGTGVAFLLPGQGSHYAGMGRRLLAEEPAFREALEECSAAFGFDIPELLEDAEGLREARFAQPAIFAMDYAIARLWQALGIQPAALIGHSVGEFVAAVLAGVFTLEDGARLVARRAELVQALPGGAMLAARLSEEEAQPFLQSGEVSLAAVNAPRLCVLSGPEEAIAAVEAACRERSLPARRLASSHAFHSHMVEPAVAPLLEAVRGARLSPPRIAIASSVTGAWLTAEEATDPEYWARHLRATVRFADGLGTLLATHAGALLECGPNQGLTQLARQHPAKAAQHEFAHTIAEEQDEAQTLGKALARLWLCGVNLDWELVPGGKNHRRVSLPAYPFERQRYFADLPAGATLPLTTAATDGEAPIDALAGATPLSTAAAPVEAPRQEASTTPGRSAVEERLRALLADLSGNDFSTAPASTSLLELGFDSLFLSQAAITLSRTFKVKVAFRQLLQELGTLGALSRFLEAGSAAAVAPAAAPAVTPLPQSSAPAGNGAHGPFRPLQPELGDTLTAQQEGWLRDFIRRYTERTGGSKSHTQKFRGILADPRAAAGFKRIWKEMVYPIVAERSEGMRIWDVDGNRWNDLTLSFGAAMFGHRAPFIVSAVQEQLERGMEIGPTSPLAGEVAGLLCELTGHERVTFCNTGSEAVSGAVRVARTITGRPRIAYFAGSYHGITDEVLGRRSGSGNTPIAPGIPAEALAQTLILDYGSPEALEQIAAHAEELAAILVEPVQSRRPEFQPAEFLRELRTLTERHGIALIFDEIITGFRTQAGGAQAAFGVKADLAVYGKVLGGGVPIGAIAGRAEYMDAFDGGAWRFGDDSFPSTAMTFFAGTFVRHPLALAAARAVLQHLREGGQELYAELNAKAGRTIASINRVLQGSPFSAVHFGSNWFLHTAPEFRFPGLLYALLRHHGLHIWENRPCFFSTAHSEADLEEVVQAFERSIAELEGAGFFARGQVAAAAPRPLPEPTPALPTPTEGQRELWCLCQQSSLANAACNESWVLHLEGPLDEPDLHAAFDTVVERHESLRTSFDVSGETLRVAEPAPVDFPLRDFSALSEEEQSARFAALGHAESARSFNLQQAPLFTGQLIRFAPERHAFLFNAHHLVCDGWSCDVFLRELAEVYSARREGRAVQLPEPFSPAAYRRWEKELHGTPEFASDFQYWMEHYRTIPAPLELPGDRPRPRVRSDGGASEVVVFPAEFAKRLQQAGARQGATLFSVLLAGYQALLQRLSGQHEFVVGVPSAGQSLAGAEHLIGHCVNLLPLRLTGREGETFAEALARVQNEVMEAFEHRTVTFGWLLRHLSIPRDPGRVPLVSTTFNLDPPLSDLHFGGLRHRLEANPRAAFQFDLGFNCDTSATGFRIICHYNTDLFDRATIRSWIQLFHDLLETGTDDPTRRIGAPSPVIAGARRPFPSELGVHEIFAAQASRSPEAVALSDGEQQLTYRELETRASAWARGLRTRGIEEGSRVGICLERSMEFVVAALAILKAGAAYVPLDPAQPAERRNQIAQDAGVTLVLNRNELYELGIGGSEAPKAGGDGASIAYVMFTSGSTGQPKGAEVRHRGISRLVLNTDYVSFGPEDVVAHASNVAFDASTFEIWGALLNGARLLVVPRHGALEPRPFLASLRTQGVTILFLTTPLFHQLAKADPGGFDFLRYLVVGGDAMDPGAARAVLESGRAPQHLVNGYGPTEVTTFAICHEVKAVPADAARIPIGRPIANTDVYLLDPDRKPVRPGEKGEIYLGGPGVARGYANRPELTAQSFVRDPFGTSAEARLYKTGDLGRQLPEGAIEFLGRIDEQVKIRGFRVEPAEIEAALSAHPEVGQCKVRVRKQLDAEKSLIGYVSARNGRAPEPEELRAFLLRRLPEYLVPSAFVMLDQWPLTPNGKIDFDRLPLPAEAVAPVAGSELRTPLEHELAQLWSTVLDRRVRSANEDFFLSGGHSLLAIRLISLIREKFEIDVPVRQLFETPTIRGLGDYLVAHWPAEAPPDYRYLVPVQRGESGRAPFFIIPGGWGGEVEFLVYAQLARQIEAQLPVYGLRAQRGEFGAETAGEVEAIAERYLQEVRRLQPSGPYRLGGECVGGIIAHEMARQLIAAGEQVDLLLLMDTDWPSAKGERWLDRYERAERRRGWWDGKVWGPLREHQEKLGRLSFAEKFRYVWERASRKRTWRKPAPQADELAELTQYPRRLMRHRPLPYAGEITLLVDEEAHRRNGALGWEGMHPGALRIAVAPGDHFSYIREHAGTAAALIRDLLARPSAVEAATTP